MPQEPRRRNRSRWLAIAAALGGLALASCATGPGSRSLPTAPMDVAMDIQGQGMFYKGVAHIPRGFNSPESFEIDFDLTHWSHPYGGGIGFQTHAVLGTEYRERGTFQPLAPGTGVISLESGRLLLRGSVQEEGEEFEGEWFFDGKAGGAFRIARKGYIFP